MDAIERRELTVTVSYATLCEAYTLVLRRLGAAYAHQWLTEILDGAVLLNPEAVDYSFAAGQLTRFPDHPITLVDAVTAALSCRLEIPVWTFDRHLTRRTRQSPASAVFTRSGVKGARRSRTPVAS